MKLTKKLVGQLYPILSLPKGCKEKGYEFIIGQYYEVVGVNVKKLTIKDENGTEVSVYATSMDLENSFSDKENRKQEFEDKNFGFDWVDSDLNVVLPVEYKEANDEDNIKEIGWSIKADSFSKGAEMKEEQIELMLDFLKRKNKVKEYQSVINEIERRKNSVNSTIDSLLS